MANDVDYVAINDAKAEYDDVYNATDPRKYFTALQKVGYEIPQRAKPVFAAVIASYRAQRETDADTVNLLDIGCSYGVNAALLKYGMDIGDLYDHYTDPEIGQVARDTLVAVDEHDFFGGPATPALAVTGLDVAENAIEYATRVGVLDDGIAANFEEDAPSPAIAEAIGDTDLVISTGCVGYVSERTFGHILDATEKPQNPWIASFVLRMFPYEPIAAAFAERGLVTEKLEGRTFIQRAFESEEEQSAIIAQLHDMGIATAGLEDAGAYHTEFFLLRPAAEAAARPLQEIFATQ